MKISARDKAPCGPSIRVESWVIP